MNLLEILSSQEGKTLEFKPDLTSPEGVLRTIVAFANTSGGRIVIGIEDGTRMVRGIREVLTEEERLANLIADSIAPKLIPSLGAPVAQDATPANRHPSKPEPAS